MARKVFVSYSHKLDQDAANRFRDFFCDERDVFIDKSIREDVGHLKEETIKYRLRRLILDSSVTVVLIGSQTGGRWWIDWEINYSLSSRLTDGRSKTRNPILGILIPNKRNWIPERLNDNIPMMAKIIQWPSNYRTLANEIENVYNLRNNLPNLSRPLRQRNSYPRVG